jgi:hypothetical protein
VAQAKQLWIGVRVKISLSLILTFRGFGYNCHDIVNDGNFFRIYPVPKGWRLQWFFSDVAIFGPERLAN